MTNIYNISPEGLLDEASIWISRLDRGLSDEEKVSLGQWLTESEQHRLALIKAGQVWDKAEVLSTLADLFPEPAEQQQTGSWKMPAIAASVVAIPLSLWLVTSFYYLFNPAAENSSELALSNLVSLYKTAIGELTHVNLPDGTELILNTDTTVRVNYSDHQRLLMLEQGELHVQVTHDENRPLSVLAGDQVIQAVGTAFNVELSSDQRVDLVVTEGRVLVGQRQDVVPLLVASDPIVIPVSALVVSEGERILLGRQDTVELVEATEIEIQLSWQDGNLVFRGEPLGQAIEEISRYTSLEFVFLDENIREVQVAGLFQTGDVDGLLAALRDSFEIDSQRVGQRILLSRR